MQLFFCDGDLSKIFEAIERGETNGYIIRGEILYKEAIWRENARLHSVDRNISDIDTLIDYAINMAL